MQKPSRIQRILKADGWIARPKEMLSDFAQEDGSAVIPVTAIAKLLDAAFEGKHPEFAEKK